MRFAEGNISDQISVILRAGTHGGSGGPTVRQHRRDPPSYTDTPRPPVQPSRVGDPDPAPAYPDRVLPGPGGRENPALAPPARSGLGGSRGAHGLRGSPVRPGPARLCSRRCLLCRSLAGGGAGARGRYTGCLCGENGGVSPGIPLEAGVALGCLHRPPPLPANNRASTRDAAL